MLNPKFLPFALLVLSSLALAQQATSANSQSLQILPVPTFERTMPNSDILRRAAPATLVTYTAKITGNRLNVAGTA